MPEGRSYKAKTEEWSPEAADGRRLTKVEPEGRGSPVETLFCAPECQKKNILQALKILPIEIH